MSLTDTFVRNVKHTGAPSGDKHTDGRAMYLLVNAIGKYWRMNYRFADMGHTPGTLVIPPASINVAASREFPFTLDLRRH